MFPRLPKPTTPQNDMYPWLAKAALAIRSVPGGIGNASAATNVITKIA
jgi:hypothetical protein